MKMKDVYKAGMEKPIHGKYQPYLVCLALCLTLSMLTFRSPLTGWCQDGASAFPEGSGSIITPLSWQFSGQDQQHPKDQAEMHKQVRAVIQQFEAAVLVKDEKDLLVLSLPSAKLTELRDKLEEFGTVTSSESSSATKAPTTLLRLTFQSSSL
jgi:hypothetical protein